jgi:hypothetical protein
MPGAELEKIRAEFVSTSDAQREVFDRGWESSESDDEVHVLDFHEGGRA